MAGMISLAHFAFQLFLKKHLIRKTLFILGFQIIVQVTSIKSKEAGHINTQLQWDWKSIQTESQQN